LSLTTPSIFSSCVKWLKSAICVPIKARGRTLGTITIVSGRAAFTQTDLALAEDIGRRAALAVDNARLPQATDVGKTSVRLSSFWVNSSNNCGHSSE